jgi:hypothetical protein
MSSAHTSGNSTPPATGGNNNNNGGRKDHRGGRNNNNTPSKAKKNQYIGLAGSDTAIYGKTVTTGPDQATQIIDLVDSLITYCGAQGYGKWTESISELKRFTKLDFVGIPPQKANYGKITRLDKVETSTFSTLGEEDYKIDYNIWKAEFGIMLKDFKQYEKEADYLFLAIKGQFEPTAWDDLEHDIRFGPICLKKCPVELINLLMETCSTNESSTWDPLARIRHLCKSITYMQKPKSAPTAVDTAQYKMYLAVYVSNAFRARGDFVFRTNFYEPFLTADSKSLINYLGMDKKGRKIYDKKVQDLLVSVLMIEGCKSKPLRDHLKNQYLTGMLTATLKWL